MNNLDAAANEILNALGTGKQSDADAAVRQFISLREFVEVFVESMVA